MFSSTVASSGVGGSSGETQSLLYGESLMEEMDDYGTVLPPAPVPTPPPVATTIPDTTNNTTPPETQEQPQQDEAAARLTHRLRCLFSAITWPIVPLGTLVSICLVWVLYSAFVLDVKSACSHPLHAYSLASLIFLVYAPYHAQIRSHLFRYSRERDGPIRPTRVRLYDQFFHTLCILYVYGGVTVLQNCKQDVGEDSSSGFLDGSGDSATTTTTTIADMSNSCELTCPHLYSSLDVYVTMLELFTLSLIIPLLFLPCIYLWFIRRAGENPSFWPQGTEDSIFGGSSSTPRVSAQELMNSLEEVCFKRMDGRIQIQSIRNITTTTNTTIGDGNNNNNNNSTSKECCICMNEFVITAADEEEGLNDDDDVIIVRTSCGHVFHKACLGGWVAGRWEEGSFNSRRARRTCCPLCRQDLKPSTTSTSTTTLSV